MYELDKRKFGSFVSSLRKEKGWTQKELAQRLFVSDKAVSKWETGRFTQLKTRSPRLCKLEY